MTGRRSLIPMVLAAALSASSAIGCEVVEWVEDWGSPPDETYDPGERGGGDGYGSSGGGVALSELGTFVCPDELQSCTHEFTYRDRGEQSVELRGDFGGTDTWNTGAPMKKLAGQWRVTVPVPVGKPVQYKFVVNGTNWVIDPAQATVTDAAKNTNNIYGGTTCEDPICQDTETVPPGVYDWRDAVIYFVFVDRFKNGGVNNCNVSDGSGPLPAISNYNGGDWPGVTQAINDDYFTKLGVNTLWLTVPLANAKVAGAGNDGHNYSGFHGYWPKLDSSQPEQLAPESCFGTMEDLKALTAAAHAKGIKVLYDYAMVHVHDSSQLYRDHGDWFWPNSNGHGGNCICGEGCSWDALPDRERCWFTGYLPHWNYTNDAARRYSVTNAVEWAKQTGIDGFRLDAIKHVDIKWLTDLRRELTAQITSQQSPSQRFYLVGETYEFGDRGVLKSYVDPATKLDGQFDFPVRKYLAESVLMRTKPMRELAAFMDTNEFYYGTKAVMSPFLGNHDLPRVIHLAQNNRPWGDDQGASGKDKAWSNQPGLPNEREAYERLAAGFAVLFSNRGAPLLYYGDEIGMPGAGDPDNRRMMQWSGLTDNQSWLRARIARLLEIRSEHPAFRRGVRQTLRVDDDVWVYVRTTNGDRVWVAVNRSDSEKEVGGLPQGELHELVTETSVQGPNIKIPPREARIFVQ